MCLELLFHVLFFLDSFNSIQVHTIIIIMYNIYNYRFKRKHFFVLYLHVPTCKRIS